MSQKSRTSNVSKYTVPALLLIAILLTLSVTKALAQQAYIAVGGSGGPKTQNIYQAIIYSPFNTLSETGLIFRVWNKTSHFSYKTDLQQAQNIKINAMALNFEAEAGWQWATNSNRIAIFSGIARRDHFLNPADPKTDLDQSSIVFTAKLDGQYAYNSSNGIMANAEFSTGKNRYWLQAKPYFKSTQNWKTGIDLAIGGDTNFNYKRFGVFISDVELPLWFGKQTFIGVGLGAYLSTRNNQFTPYGEFHLGYLF